MVSGTIQLDRSQARIMLKLFVEGSLVPDFPVDGARVGSVGRVDHEARPGGDRPNREESLRTTG